MLYAVLQFFKDCWIKPDYNTNILVMIPKVSNADSIDQFRPIALANFKNKIVTKIIADWLALVMPFIISPEQRAFIKGRCIKECISVTSEAINLLWNKCKNCNLALKVYFQSVWYAKLEFFDQSSQSFWIQWTIMQLD